MPPSQMLESFFSHPALAFAPDDPSTLPGVVTAPPQSLGFRVKPLHSTGHSVEGDHRMVRDLLREGADPKKRSSK